MNRAARVKSKAAAGQVVVSSKTWNSCTHQEDFAELDLGEFTLKGVEEPINLFQISKKVSRFVGWTSAPALRFPVFSLL